MFTKCSLINYRLLRKEDRQEVNSSSEVKRPWGTYESVVEGTHFQVRLIRVYPEQELSLQLHHKRSEHWVVVSGEATVTKDESTFVLKENESTFIPLGTKHSLANFTKDDLEIIEVQYGEYLGEDDIVRFKDKYGRVDHQNEDV